MSRDSKKFNRSFEDNDSNSATPMSHQLGQNLFEALHQKRGGHNQEWIDCGGKLVTASLLVLQVDIAALFRFNRLLSIEIRFASDQSL